MTIKITQSPGNYELIRKLSGLPSGIRIAIVEKMQSWVNEVYQKVHGRIPSFKIDHGVEVQGSLAIGFFEPAEPKAIAREFGGKSYYEIVPTKSKLLKFIGSKDARLVYTSSVFHPPSREFRDIRNQIEHDLPELNLKIEAAIASTLKK